ncbi:MAG TPA: PilZ domain-containing protein [Gemmataceae bacterium]|nr:PilZ domain-containing protein [Gemmataceae bacterium]
MANRPVLGEPAQAPGTIKLERRAFVRHACELEALSRAVELADSICWGATVQDVSAGGIGLQLCYPFKAGTFLAVEVRHESRTQTFLVRVVHAADQADGSWFLGCEFAAPLTEAELADLL